MKISEKELFSYVNETISKLPTELILDLSIGILESEDLKETQKATLIFQFYNEIITLGGLLEVIGII